MSSNPEPKNKAIEEDDLTQIKGIGDTTQQWLRETFQVYTYHDLAILEVDEIESKLRADRKIAFRNKIEMWVAQAQERAGSVTQPAKPEKQEVVNTKAWQTIASFVVVFEERDTGEQVQLRTNAHYMEADETQTWMGIKEAELVKWMSAQLGEKDFQEVQPEPSMQMQMPQQDAFIDASNKLENILATVNHLSSDQANASAIGRAVEPTVAIPSSPNAKLQEILATANRLKSQETVPVIAHTGDVRPQQRSGVSSSMSGQPTFDSLTEPFSERLQEVIAKSRQLSGEDNSLSNDN